MAAPFLANSAVERSSVTRPFVHHFESCIRCQARYAAMAKTARELRELAGKPDRAPLDLEWQVMSSLQGDLAIARSWRRPVAVAAALLSMAAAVVIWKMRPRTL
jgi:hypothetical protein